MSYDKAQCDKFEYIVTTSPNAERSLEDRKYAASHREACPKCAAFESEMAQLEGMLHRIPTLKAGEGFEQAIMGRVHDLRSGSPSLWERVLGPLAASATAPLGRRGLALASAAAVCVLLAAGGFAIHGRQAQPAPPAPAMTTVVDLPTALADEDMTDLIRRHQAVAMAQPLSDDPGLRLVSFSPSDE